MALEWLMTTEGPDKRVIGMDEKVELKGGDKFQTVAMGEAERILGRKIEYDEHQKPIMSDADLEKLGRALAIRDALKDKSPRNARRLLRKMKRYLRKDRRVHSREAERLDVKLAYIRSGLAAFEEIEQWVNNRPLAMEQPPVTRFHKLLQSARDREIIVLETAIGDVDPRRIDNHEIIETWEDASVFVVEHDWAAAFANATDYEGGQFRMPDEVCAFEFKISGRHIIAITFWNEDDDTLYLHPIFLTESGWMVPRTIYKHSNLGWLAEQRGVDDKKGDCIFDLVQMIGAQIRAVAIALDAEVAQTNMIRADHKLNHAREKRGQLPIYDYHVVSLARRTRADPLPRDPNAEPGTRKRWHFVRGHWRHFEHSKTWVRWHLRGDQNLGFIDKHYKL